MTKHHPNLDLSSLVLDEVEKELLANHPSEVSAKNVMQEATDTTEVMEKAAITTPVDPVPDK